VVEMSQIVSLEDKIHKLESEIQKLKTELSIAVEYYAEVREFLNDLLNLAKTTELKKQELEYSRPQSILENTYSKNIKSRSRLDDLMEKCVSLIFQDYKSQGG
jgi:polyhydroxyalkanoate synthesis regulator phasin